MKAVHDLSQLQWTLIGTTPYAWLLSGNPVQVLQDQTVEQEAIPAIVPGSVQKSLLNAGILPDWNSGLNARLCEWVENRHWIYSVHLPDEWFQSGKTYRLSAAGLDDRGWVYLNGKEIGTFKTTHLPYLFDLTDHLQPAGNLLQIIFDCPPRWLGQFGYTSKMTDWKPRFYYTWDWVSRIVQIGIWNTLTLEESDGAEIFNLKVCTEADPASALGSLEVRGSAGAPAGAKVKLELSGDEGVIYQELLPLEVFNGDGVRWDALPVKLWYPNGLGSQPLYRFTYTLLGENGQIHDCVQRTIGFRHITWQPCEGAPANADPWICAVNGRPVFLQGFNWTPILPNFADTGEADYRLRLERYREMGVNILRMWGGAMLEKEIFFQLCDEMGILVWQEFPLSSSGVDNWPPEDETSIAELSQIARSYITRRSHHACLLMWGGGNELQGDLDGNKTGVGKPVDLSHPLIRRFAEIAAEEDPGRRFVPTSSSGPYFYVKEENIGKGLHWDVHGPWKADPDLAAWEAYWKKVDALFHSEVGCPGASSVEIIQCYSGGLPTMPASPQNRLWRRTPWWIEWDLFLQQGGREDSSLEEYVRWSQERQAQALTIVARSLKNKFPRCGGVIFWMGHDCFPCTANTSVIEFDGRYKPAALALKKVFQAS